MTEKAGGSQGNTGAGAGDGGTSSFLDSMSEDMRGNAQFEGIDSADALGQKFLDMNTSFEELKSQQPAGAPEEISGYEFETPEGISFNEDESNAFKEYSKESGFSNDVYQKIMKFETDRIAASSKAATDKHAENITALKKEFGDKYDQALSVADKALQASPFAKDLLGSDDPAEMTKILADSPLLFRVFNWIGTAISQDSLESGGRGGVGDSRQKNEAGKPMLKYKDMD